jgi:RNA polymerase sigma-70 factor (ECF subfamily)
VEATLRWRGTLTDPPAAPKDSTPQSPVPSKRLARARARALGQRTPYTMSLAERLLIARLVERDEQAFGEIVRQYGDKVFSLIYRMLGNRQEAEDVAQDVFITVFKTIDSFRGEAKFSTWLLRIAANHAKNRIKYLARRATDKGGLDEAPEAAMADLGKAPAQAHVSSPEAALEAAERGTALEQAIASLDEDHRLVLVLRDIEELAYEEICEITGLPEGTVKSRIHRARLALKERLARERG